MDKIDLQSLKSNTTNSVFFLTVRNLSIQAVSLIGFFILTLLLGTGEVGLFAIVAESISILGYFSDLGLASALIQQKKEVSKKDLQTTFLIQQLLVFVLLLIAAILYRSISNSRNYGSKEFWIMFSLCFSFVMASFKTIPSILLERKLNFKIISTVDVVENLSFYIFAVFFAFMGYGAYSYAIATFIRSVLGVVLIYHFKSWPFGYSYSQASAKKLFRFGIPFQLNTFIAVAKDRFSSLLVAGILGRESYGLLSWAQKGPRIPLSFMDAIMKVTFPTFSRLQQQPKILKKSIEKSIYFIALFVFPMLSGIAIIAPDLVDLIPKYSKWSPAIIPMYFYCLNSAIAAVTTPLTNAFNAIGKITTTTKFMIMWTVLTWIFYPILSIKYGYYGTAIATLIVGLSSIIVWFSVYRQFSVNIIRVIIYPLISSLAMILLLQLVPLLSLPLIAQISTKIFFGILVYIGLIYYFSKDELIWFFNQLQWLRFKK